MLISWWLISHSHSQAFIADLEYASDHCIQLNICFRLNFLGTALQKSFAPINPVGFINPKSANPTKWSTNFLSIFDDFMGLALKGLTSTHSVFPEIMILHEGTEEAFNAFNPVLM